MEKQTGSAPDFEFVVVPGNARFDADDERWLAQVSAFGVDARREVPGASSSAVPVSGTKGAATSLIIALGTSGAFEAALGFFRAWLGRDKDRTLDFSWEEGGRRTHVALRGADLSKADVERLTEAVAKKVGS